MDQFINIITNILLPIFIQIGLGFFLQKKFHFNIRTLTKLQFYIFIPALLFTNLYTSNISGTLVFYIAFIVILVFVVMLILSLIVSRFSHFTKPVRSSFINSILFFNSGNYCIPLVVFLYSGIVTKAKSILIIILLVQNLLLNTYGIFNANAGNKTAKQSLFDTFKIPMIYAAILAVIFRIGNLGVPSPIITALNSLTNGMVPLALVTLGAQLAETKLKFNSLKIFVSNIFRLLIAPTFAFMFVIIFSINHINPLAAQIIVIASGAPTAVNTVLLAIEYKNEPDLSSKLVFSSTLLSAITVSLIIGVVQILIPL